MIFSDRTKPGAGSFFLNCVETDTGVVTLLSARVNNLSDLHNDRVKFKTDSFEEKS